MDDTINISIPIDAEIAGALDRPGRREAVGRYISELLRTGQLRDVLAEAIADAKKEARTAGLTDTDIDAEIEAWRAERRS